MSIAIRLLLLIFGQLSEHFRLNMESNSWIKQDRHSMSIKRIQSDDPLSQSKDLVQDSIEKLKVLFPQIVTEDKIDFSVLKEILGEEVEHGEEYYCFTWAGKTQARREAHKPSTGTLIPVKEESLDWETTQNLYIEGDNLEVLKLLQKSYAEKVKMIYIDPPYNTGSDFVYKDDYRDNLRNYQEFTGELDSEGKSLTNNSDSDGRYHSNWLNMMYPRLILGRNLLQDDGVIFVSIDDHEVHNLRLLMDDVFGQINFLGQIVVETANGVFGTRATGLKTTLVKTKDYVIVYSKSNKANNFKPLYMPTNERFDIHFKSMLDANLKKKSFVEHIKSDNNISQYFQQYKLKISLSNIAILMEIDKYFNELIIKKYSDKIYQDVDFSLKIPPEINSDLLKGQIVKFKNYLIFRTNNGKGKIRQLTSFKQTLRVTDDYKPEYRRSVAIGDLWEGFDNDMKNVLNEGGVHFDTPKPIRLIKQLIKWCNVSSNEIVLDFFSGSATSAHAVMNLNIENGCNCKYVMVQLPEKVLPKDKAFKVGFKTIAEIGRERIRRVIQQIRESHPEKSEAMDLGFKVFRLDSSNINAWDGSPENLEANLFDAVNSIKPDRNEEDVLYEILLKYGLDLTSSIEQRLIERQKVYKIYGGGGAECLFVCLGDSISSKVAEGIGKWKEDGKNNLDICKVIFKDCGLTDVEKTNSVLTLKRFGINEVRSI